MSYVKDFLTTSNIMRPMYKKYLKYKYKYFDIESLNSIVPSLKSIWHRLILEQTIRRTIRRKNRCVATFLCQLNARLRLRKNKTWRIKPHSESDKFFCG